MHIVRDSASVHRHCLFITKPMARRHIATGIDIGSSNVRVVVSEYLESSSMPVIIGTGIAEARGLRHGYIVSVPEATESIRLAVAQAEKSSGMKIKRAFIAVGGISVESEIAGGSVFVSRADNEVSDTDVLHATTAAEEHLGKTTNREVLQQVPIFFKLDSEQVLGKPQGMKGSRLEATVLFITCLTQHLRDFMEATEQAGISVDDVLPSPIAASFVTLMKRQRTAGCALANIGAETLSLAVFENDMPVSLKIFPIGGTEITNDIALGLRVPLEEAEEIKRGSRISAYSKKKVEDIVVARLSDIFDLINAHLKKIGKQGLLPAGIIITGGSSAIPLIEELAKKTLEIPSKVASPDFAKNTKNQIHDASWAVAYGLTIMGLDENGIDTGGIMLPKTRANAWAAVKRAVKQFLP